MGKKKKQEKRKEKEEKIVKAAKGKKKEKADEKAEKKTEKKAKDKRAEKSEKPLNEEKVTGRPEKTIKPEKADKTKTVERPDRPAVKPNGNADAITDQRLAEIFKAIGDENRIQILSLLEGREVCAGDLLKSLSIVQSTLSHHMKILTESGIVVCRKEGKRSWYSIDSEMLAKVSRYIMKWS